MSGLLPSTSGRCAGAAEATHIGTPARRLRRGHRAPTPPRALRPPSLGGVDLSSIKGVDAGFDVDALDARDIRDTSYVSRRRLEMADFDPDAVDAEGLPLVYNEERIAEYWKGRPGELTTRWTRFAGIALPWLSALANSFLRGRLEADQTRLARSAVDNMERLGPTFIKLGQILSIRPDVLPPAVMAELAKLQDKIEPFSTIDARMMVESDLGRPIDDIFSEFSEAPIAAASLAQVYRARLRESGEEVAVKVQRPAALSTISKDLYVMRRGVGVAEGVLRRFTAQQTDYQRLVSTFAEGLYTEMDFRNEALNMTRMAQLLEQSEFATSEVVIPQPLMQYTTRRVMTMEWITGTKLTLLPPEEIRALAKVGQEAFLTQLLEIGFFHGDPHPGNLLKVTEGPNEGKLALLDFGLVAEIPAADREAMVSATIHLANRDWDALVTDFVLLGFLPASVDRGLVVPVMDRVLSPYLRGGGARSFNFQALSQDLLSVTLEIPFSVPPYMSLLARSVATLEGIALAGDPGYQMVTQAYPFVVRKVLRGDSTRTAAVLRDILYDADGRLKTTRLSTLLNAALGVVADAQSGFVDFDAVPEDGASLQEIVAFLLSKEASSLRPLLVSELTSGVDLFMRDRARKAYALLRARAAPRLPFIGALPAPPAPPVFVPAKGFIPQDEFVDLFFPRLTDAEEVVLDTQVGLIATILGVDADALGEGSFDSVTQLLFSPSSQLMQLQSVLVRLGSERDGDGATARVLASTVLRNVLQGVSVRVGVPVDTLFPLLSGLLDADERRTSSTQSRDLFSARQTSPRASASSLLETSNALNPGPSAVDASEAQASVHRSTDARSTQRTVKGDVVGQPTHSQDDLTTMRRL